MKKATLNTVFLGSNDVQISETETCSCDFYLMNPQDSSTPYFITTSTPCSSTTLTHILKINDNTVIMVFNEPLKDYSYVLERGINKEIIEKMILIKPVKKQRKTLKKPSSTEEPLCLLEILRDILLDDNCKLLWDYGLDYKRIGVKSTMIEDEYKFINPKEGFGQVVDLSLGSKKLNINVKVKVQGQVENTLTKLKLDGYILKDYNLMVDGKVNTPYLCCELSQKLKPRLRREKVLKNTIDLFGREICILNLKKIQPTNERLLNSLSEEEILRNLYDITVLNCKQWAVKKVMDKLIKTMDFHEEYGYFAEGNEDTIRNSYRVSSKGMYTPLKLTKAPPDTCEVYPVTIIEWTIHRFPKKKEEDKALGYYESLITEYTKDSYKLLTNELKKIKEEKHKKEILVNTVRLARGLSEKSIFQWDAQSETNKFERDKTLNINMIVDGKATVSMKTINNITLKETFYKVLVKCN